MSTYNRAAVFDPAVPEEHATPAAPHDESIAIVGMAVNMPGAPDASRLWEVHVLENVRRQENFLTLSQILEHGINTVAEVRGLNIVQSSALQRVHRFRDTASRCPTMRRQTPAGQREP